MSEPTIIQAIIQRLDEIVANKTNEPLHVLGSYVVGATIVRDDIDDLYQQYPDLEMVADLGSELETLAGTTHEAIVFQQLKNTLTHFKQTLKKSNPPILQKTGDKSPQQ